MPSTKSLVAALILIVFVRAWFELPLPARTGFTPATRRVTVSFQPLYESRFVTRGVVPQVHAATLTEISNRRLRAFWYGGTREGAEDVAIYSSVFDPVTDTWSAEKPVFTRESTQWALKRYVKKLGNPVAYRDPDRRLWLFYVSVSMGGWGGSAINLTFSHDDGQTWSAPRRLISSPFLNLSTLVKHPPLPLQDGRLALPASHEFIGLFGELLRLDREGHVIGKTRLSRGRYSLQPAVVPSSSADAIGLMRYAGAPPKRILATRTGDGGEHWTRPWKTELPNPNAAFACIRLDDGSLLLVFNNNEIDRGDLSLATSPDDGQTWRIIHRFESEGGFEYSYPYLTQASNGDFHLLYTWHREQIKHVHFNQVWLDERTQ